MTQHHAHEGDDAQHPHIHPQGPPPRPLDMTKVVHMDGPPPGMPVAQPLTVQALLPMHSEVVAAKAQEWFAREFVGGLVAIAQIQGVKLEDFLAEKCALLAMRVANLEGELAVVKTQAQVLQNQVDDCGCHDEDVTPSSEAVPPPPPSTTNGDAG